MAIIVTVVIALFFFLGGCMKLGIFIARSPDVDVAELVNQALVQAWPLAVAALLFLLIDIRLHQRSTSAMADDVSDIPEHPLPTKVGQAQDEPTHSYFRIDGQQLPPSPPEHGNVWQRTYHQGPSPFSTPPPFEGHVPPSSPPSPPPSQPPAPPSDSPEKQDEGLSFFKL